MNDLNSEYNRVLELIQANSVKFNEEEEGYIWEEIELDTFTEIVKFALEEGLDLSKEDCAILLDNEKYNEDREFDISIFDGMVAIAKKFDEMRGMDFRTLELYRVFNERFYN